jgi:hypothetical protein
MASEPDRLILSAKERQVLADLEAALQHDAPDLEASLTTGRHRRAPGRGAQLALRRRLAALALPVRLALSLALIVLGLAVMILTFTQWIPVALLGVAIQGVGLWGVLDTLAGWRRRRAKG